MKMTGEMIAKAQEMRETGMSYAKIGAVLGVSHSTIRYQLDPKCKEYHAGYRTEHEDEKNEYMRGYHVENRDRCNARSKAYAEEHKDELSGYHAAYRAEHKQESRAYYAAYYAAHRDERAARNAEWYAANKDRVAAYREKNKEKRASQSRIWRRNHMAEDAARSAARRALKAGWLIGATAAQRAEVDEVYRKAKEEPNIRCHICGKRVPLGSRHVDHVQPISKGGAHRASNLGVSCALCNLKKHDKLPGELGLLL